MDGRNFQKNFVAEKQSDKLQFVAILLEILNSEKINKLKFIGLLLTDLIRERLYQCEEKFRELLERRFVKQNVNPLK